jgi:hypothetical protein
MARAATFAVQAVSGFRSEAVETSVFWDVMRRMLLIGYRSFGTTYRQASFSKVKQFKKNIHPLKAAALRSSLKEIRCFLGGRY